MDDKLGGVTVTDFEQPREPSRVEPNSRVAAPAAGWETRPRTMARKKVSTTVYIEPEQADQLKVLHERTKVPVAVYIREGIELVLAKYQHVLPGQLTLEQQRRAAQSAGTNTSSSSPGNTPNTPPANTGSGTGTGG